MKRTILAGVILLMGVASHGSELSIGNNLGLGDIFGLGGDPTKVPVEEDPGKDAEVIKEAVHSKEIRVAKENVSFKWTGLGYGQLTEKVIVPELAKHTLFNHRNRGEDGPCLRSYRFPGAGSIKPTSDVVIDIVISNQYEINREKNICRVSMVEDVKTIINGVELSHTYKKPMGFRYIEDCP
ncbi:MAG: hypothetical protein ACRBBP_06110 [Bdellovibrionales bacterium]